MSIFEQWDEQFDSIFEEVAEYEASSDNKDVDYAEVPHGTYEVAVETMEIKATKSSGKPMLTIWFRILEGEFENNIIFYNQVIEKDFQISMAKKMLKKLVSESDKAPEINPKSFREFGSLVMDIQELIADDFEYLLEYKAGKNGFSNYNIKKVFPLA